MEPYIDFGGMFGWFTAPAAWCLAGGGREGGRAGRGSAGSERGAVLLHSLTYHWQDHSFSPWPLYLAACAAADTRPPAQEPIFRQPPGGAKVGAMLAAGNKIWPQDSIVWAFYYMYYWPSVAGSCTPPPPSSVLPPCWPRHHPHISVYPPLPARHIPLHVHTPPARPDQTADSATSCGV